MIISLRGTSGSGKSHLARQIMDLYSRHRSVYTEGRMKPLYDIHGRNESGRCLVTPGHYLIPNGGVDTLPSLDEAYRIARWAAWQEHDVLMEGKNMSDGLGHIDLLRGVQKFDVRLVCIDVPLSLAVQSVRKRGHKIAEKSIERTLAKVRRDFDKFEGHKFMGTREQCRCTIAEWLGPFPETEKFNGRSTDG
jgi:ABC-type dipeptide/oligopeptide/nickel transport system ATPase component